MTRRLVKKQAGGVQRVVDLGAGGNSGGAPAGTVDDLEPFATTSVWRLGVAQSATFAATDDARNTAMHNTGADGSGKVWVNFDIYSHPISYASDSDPLATVTDTDDGQVFQERIPATARIAAGTDAHMHIVTPDKQYVQEHFAVERQSPTAYTTLRRLQVPLAGPGIGPQNGTRAYGGSAIGGLIRSWEVDPTHPRYTGVIRHALACSLRNEQLYVNTALFDSYYYYSSGTLDPARHPGWPAGQSAVGFMRQPGYVWPATEQDWGSADYGGPIPMGSYFAIPGTVNLATLGLQSSQGMMLAKAAQDYGVYVTDRSGSQAFYCEDDGAGPANTFARAVTGGESYSGHDARVVFNALRLVSGNTYAAPNGGALGSARRA